MSKFQCTQKANKLNLENPCKKKSNPCLGLGMCYTTHTGKTGFDNMDPNQFGNVKS